MKREYAIIVRNKTRLETLIERFNTKTQAQFYIESNGGRYEEYELEHERFYVSLNKVQSQLSKLVKNKLLDRSHLPNYLFSEKQFIVVVGQDGLVANTAKYSNGLPIIAINPDKSSYDGVLLLFDEENFVRAVQQVLKDDFDVQRCCVNFQENS